LTLAGQSLARENCAAFGPVVAMPLIVSAAVAVSVNVMVCAGGGQKFLGLILQLKARLAGTSFTVPLVRVIVAWDDLVVSATALALSITAALAGTVAGAVYVVGTPLAALVGLIVPHPGEQLVPFCVSVQVTPAFVASLPIVAVNCCVALTGMIPLFGETAETAIAGTVTVADEDLVESETDEAVTVTVKSVDGGPGAVYVTAAPPVVEVGETLPQGAVEHETVHVTPLLLGSLPTVAVNSCVVPASTVAVWGSVSTVIAGTVIVAEAIAKGLVTEVAVTVTVKSLAGRPGAV
jgi:hypothetical protein